MSLVGHCQYFQQFSHYWVLTAVVDTIWLSFDQAPTPSLPLGVILIYYQGVVKNRNEWILCMFSTCLHREEDYSDLGESLSDPGICRSVS